MPTVYEDAVNKDILSGNFSRVYILYGDDSYLKKFYFDKITQKAYDGDPLFNLQKFEGDCSLQDVFDAVNQFPMMASSKCVTLTDFDYEHCSSSELDLLCEIVSQVEEGCVLVLRFDAISFELKNNQKALKIKNSVEKINGKLVCLNHRERASLTSTLVSAAKKRGCILSEKDALFLIETVGDDLNVLKNELDKLCAFVKTGKIERKIINDISVESIESSVYKYAQEIVDGNLSSALKILDGLFYQRVEPFLILYTASSLYIDAYRVFSGKKCDMNLNDILNDFSYKKNKTFVLEKAAAKLKKLDFKRLSLSFDELIIADKKLKSFGSDPRLVLEELTVRLVYIVVNGDSID